eukprot:1068128-Alexandrium_andersonii.AAC.1
MLPRAAWGNRLRLMCAVAALTLGRSGDDRVVVVGCRAMSCYSVNHATASKQSRTTRHLGTPR